VLTTFAIDDFGAFSHLRVERLGRVNLVVGRNNVGKTMFLEALRLHALGGTPAALRNLLLERDEVVTEITPTDTDEPDLHLRVASLFYRGPSGRPGQATITLGPIGEAARALTIEPRIIRRVRIEGGG